MQASASRRPQLLTAFCPPPSRVPRTRSIRGGSQSAALRGSLRRRGALQRGQRLASAGGSAPPDPASTPPIPPSTRRVPRPPLSNSISPTPTPVIFMGQGVSIVRLRCTETNEGDGAMRPGQGRSCTEAVMLTTRTWEGTGKGRDGEVKPRRTSVRALTAMPPCRRCGRSSVHHPCPPWLLRRRSPCFPLQRRGTTRDAHGTGPSRMPGPVHLVTRERSRPQDRRPVGTGRSSRWASSRDTTTRTGTTRVGHGCRAVNVE